MAHNSPWGCTQVQQLGARFHEDAVQSIQPFPSTHLGLQDPSSGSHWYPRLHPGTATLSLVSHECCPRLQGLRRPASSGRGSTRGTQPGKTTGCGCSVLHNGKQRFLCQSFKRSTVLNLVRGHRGVGASYFTVASSAFNSRSFHIRPSNKLAEEVGRTTTGNLMDVLLRACASFGMKLLFSEERRMDKIRTVS
eukprot:1161047-Pelagomonas_calceolata.AAC.4